MANEDMLVKNNKINYPKNTINAKYFIATGVLGFGETIR